MFIGKRKQKDLYDRFSGIGTQLYDAQCQMAKLKVENAILRRDVDVVLKSVLSLETSRKLLLSRLRLIEVPVESTVVLRKVK